MTEEVRVLGFVVLVSTLATLAGFALYRVLKYNRKIIYERCVSIGQVINERAGTIRRKLVNWKGRRILARVTIVLALFLVLVYFVPISVSSFRSQPLYGNFDMGMKCMGGHEIFLFLEEDEAFEHCPGHRDMSLMGRIERTGDSITIYQKHDDAPWCRVDFDGSEHSLVFLKDSSRHDLPQVNNPWRTWLPRLLPED
jgi:hypothetical protein